MLNINYFALTGLRWGDVYFRWASPIANILRSFRAKKRMATRAIPTFKKSFKY